MYNFSYFNVVSLLDGALAHQLQDQESKFA